MGKLIDGSEYRALQNGYLLIKGSREIYIIAKTVNQIAEAKKIMALMEFDKTFKSRKSIKISILGDRVRTIYLK